MPPAPENADRPRPSARRWIIAGGILVLLLGASGAFWFWSAGQPDRDALNLLGQDNPDTRRLGAWMAARERAPKALAEMARRLAASSETSPLVRESYVYGLAHGTEPGQLDVLEQIVSADPSPYVRQAAWRALARRDPGRFGTAARAGTTYDDPWDQIGLACGWLEVGDTRGVDTLLHWAANGSAEQKQVASLALSRGLAPLLEAAGCWPLYARHPARRTLGRGPRRGNPEASRPA